MKTLILVSILALTLGSCANKSKKHTSEINKEIENEIETAAHKDRNRVKHDIYLSILESDSLTKDQKTKLLKLAENSKQKDSSIRKEIDAAKLVLIQTIIEPKMDQTKYNSLVTKITDLTKQRLNLSFLNAQEVRKIINKSNLTESDRKMYNVIYRTHLHDNY